MNNDRLKLRVWDCDNKEYLKFGYNPDYVLDIDPNMGKLDYREICDNGFNIMTHPLPTDKLIVEQCTGLRDKNGNLIYESDIVLYKGAEYLVKWFDGCFVLAPIKSSCDMAGYRPFTELSVVPKLLEKEWEIIGNVHTEEQNNDR